MYRLIKQYQYRRRRKKELNGLGLNADDNVVWLISYPKSGNTWLRFILGELVASAESTEISLSTLSKYVPDSHRADDRKFICSTIESRSNKNLPIVLKSHDMYSPFFKGHKVIYLYRNIFDVIPSYYRYLSARTTQKIDIIKLARGELKVSHRDWLSHLKSWAMASHADILFVSYDEIKVAPLLHLNRMLKFAGFQISSSELTRVLANNSFESLKAREDKYGHKIDGRIPSTDPLAFFSSNRAPLNLQEGEKCKLQAELERQAKLGQIILDKMESGPDDGA
jgi:hypothetical protein